MSADLVDTKDALFAKLPLAAAIIALVTFAVLFLQFGSVVIPIKAVILNLLSLSATFGAMVWVFQDGNLSRSEEHTSELQSLMRISYAVFCLKKKLNNRRLTRCHTQCNNTRTHPAVHC